MPASKSVTAEDAFEDDLEIPSPVAKINKRRRNDDSETDTDFQADSEEEEEEEGSEAGVETETVGAQELADTSQRKTNAPSNKQSGAVTSRSQFPSITLPRHSPSQQPRGSIMIEFPSTSTHNVERKPPPQFAASQIKGPKNGVIRPLSRATLPILSLTEPVQGTYGSRTCPACLKNHPQGACELKVAGVEYCGLCGLAHFGYSRTCPHIKSETQVRAMLDALKRSPENKELVDLAVKYLRGVKGTLVQQKKRDREKASALARAAPNSSVQGPIPQQYHGPNTTHTQSQHHRTSGPIQHMDQSARQPHIAYVEQGSVGSYTHQRAMQTQNNGGPQSEDYYVENALKGYLGHRN